MYFPFSKLRGWGKRTVIQPQTICSEIPQKALKKIGKS